jgi:hypothetical protein
LSLERRDSGSESHFVTKVPTLDGVAEAFDSFASGDDSRRVAYAWTPFDV